MNLIYIFLGGGLGAAARWGIAQIVNTPLNGFPYSTLAVNLVGCFLIGIASVFLLQNNDKLQLLLVVGFLGGFTTFSSFGLDLFKMFEQGNWKMLFSYFILSNVIGLLLVVVGNKLMSNFIR